MCGNLHLPKGFLNEGLPHIERIWFNPQVKINPGFLVLKFQWSPRHSRSQFHLILEISALSRDFGPPENTSACSSSPLFYFNTFLRSGGALASWKHLRSTLGTLGIQAGGAPNMWGSVATSRADAFASPAYPLPPTSSALTAPSSAQDSHLSNIPGDGLLNGAHKQSCVHATTSSES